MTSLSRLSAWPRVAVLFIICFVLHAGTCQHGTHRLRVKTEQNKRPQGTENSAQVVAVPYNEEDTCSPFEGMGRLRGGMEDVKERHKVSGDENKAQEATPSAATQYGLGIHHIDGDGNCLFRAVADQLQKTPFNVTFSNQQDYHSTIRRIAVAQVSNNKGLYQDSCYDGFEGVEDWLTKMSQDKCWGGQVALRALSDALQVTLVAIRAEAKSDERPTIYKPKQSKGVIYLHFKNGNHYESLSQLPSMSAAQQKQWQALQSTLAQHTPSSYVPQDVSLAKLIAEYEKQDKHTSPATAGETSADGSEIDSKHGAAGKPLEKAQEEEKKQEWWQTYQERYKTTAALVAALNQATDEQDRQGLCYWLQQYVDTFASKSATGLVVSANSQAYLAEYATLSEIAPKDEPTAQLLLRYFNSILNKIPDQRIAAEECIMHLLVATLSNIEPTIFKGSTADLTTLSHRLFNRLKDLNSQALHAENYRVYGNTFEALHHAFDLIGKILGTKKWTREADYKYFKKGLLDLKKPVKQGGYYLFLHQLYRIEGSLKQLKEPDAAKSHGAAWKRRAKRVGQGLGGLLRMLTSIRASIVPGVNQEQFVRGAKSIAAAFHRQGIFKDKESLSKQHKDLSEAMEAIYEGKPGALAAFTKRFSAFMQALPEPIGAEEKIRIVLSYDLVEKLLSLAHQSPSAAVFKGCQVLAEELAKQLKGAQAKYQTPLHAQQAQDIQQALDSGFGHLQEARQAAAQEGSFYHQVLRALHQKRIAQQGQGLLSEVQLDKLRKLLAGPKLDAEKLQAFDQLLREVSSKSINKEDFEQRMAALEKSLKTLKEYSNTEVGDQLTDITDNMQDNYKDLANRVTNVKEALGPMILKLHTRVEVMLSSLMHQKVSGGQGQITTGEVQVKFQKEQQKLLKGIENRQGQYGEILNEIRKNIQETVVDKLEAIAKAQKGNLTIEALRKELSGMKIMATEVKGMQAKLSTLLQEATGAEGHREELAKEIVEMMNAHVSREHERGYLKTQALMRNEFATHRAWISAMVSGDRAPQQALAQRAVVLLDEATKSTLAQYFPSIEEAVGSLRAVDIKIVESSKKRGLRLQKQGKRYEQQGKLETAQTRYQWAVEAYEEAWEQFGAAPSPGSDLYRRYHEVEECLQKAKEDLARVRRGAQAEAKQFL